MLASSEDVISEGRLQKERNSKSQISNFFAPFGLKFAAAAVEKKAKKERK